MKNEELKMSSVEKVPFYNGLFTFIAFFIMGLVPLLAYLLDHFFDFEAINLFFWSAILTGCVFLGIGYLRSFVTLTNKYRSMVETLLLGSLAATIAFYVGDVLEKVLSN
jgi:VIT1/CCC1 family predicted Fe2+/Mn2+ transporter